MVVSSNRKNLQSSSIYRWIFHEIMKSTSHFPWLPQSQSGFLASLGHNRLTKRFARRPKRCPATWRNQKRCGAVGQNGHRNIEIVDIPFMAIYGHRNSWVWMGKLWKITIFNGKTHYFYGDFPLVMLNYQSVHQLVNQLIGFVGKNHRKIPWSSWENLVGFRFSDFPFFVNPLRCLTLR